MITVWANPEEGCGEFIDRGEVLLLTPEEQELIEYGKIKCGKEAEVDSGSDRQYRKRRNAPRNQYLERKNGSGRRANDICNRRRPAPRRHEWMLTSPKITWSRRTQKSNLSDWSFLAKADFVETPDWPRKPRNGKINRYEYERSRQKRAQKV